MRETHQEQKINGICRWQDQELYERLAQRIEESVRTMSVELFRVSKLPKEINGKIDKLLNSRVQMIRNECLMFWGIFGSYVRVWTQSLKVVFLIHQVQIMSQVIQKVTYIFLRGKQMVFLGPVSEMERYKLTRIVDPNAPDGDCECPSNFKCRSWTKSVHRSEPKNKRKKHKERDDDYDSDISDSDNAKYTSDSKERAIDVHKALFPEVSFHHGPM